jgi:Activator of Hsp90 ATPase homolog 1-like protein
MANLLERSTKREASVMKALILAILFTAAGVSAQTSGPLSPVRAQPDDSTSAPDDSTRVLRIELLIPAPVHDVWEAFTTEKGLSSWLAPDVSVDLKSGGDWLVSFPEARAAEPS